MKNKCIALLLFTCLMGSSVLGLDKAWARTATKTEAYKTISEIPYRSGKLTAYQKSRCKLDLYLPPNKNFTTVVWFHGGGLTGGNKELPFQLKNKNIAIIGVNYRLSPKVKVKEIIEDAAAAVAWAFKNIKKYGGDPDKIMVSGHSAGGYLTSMVGLDKSYLMAHGIDANRIAVLVPFSGHMITHFTVRKERDISGNRPIIDAMAPLYHVRADAPRLVLITGGREVEMLGRYEENAYMMRMMRVNGHKKTSLYEFDGLGHGEMVKPGHNILLKYIRKIKAKKVG